MLDQIDKEEEEYRKRLDSKEAAAAATSGSRQEGAKKELFPFWKTKNKPKATAAVHVLSS